VTPDDLQLADATGMALLLEKEKTAQARLELEKARLDHEWRMLTFSGTSAVDNGQGALGEIVGENGEDEEVTEPLEDEMDVEEDTTTVVQPEGQSEVQVVVPASSFDRGLD
jgi:hypothetical protein